MTNFNDDISKAQFLSGTSGDDTFIIPGLSTDYDWEKVLDPTGQTTMIVWKKDGSGQADVLHDIENLQFTDTTVTPDASDNGYIYTTTSTDTSSDDLYDDNSSDYSSSDDTYDDTSSDDTYDDTSSDDSSSDDTYDDTSSDDTYDDDTADHDVDLDEVIYDEYTVSEEVDGYGGHDSFVISADSSEYGWNPTEDGQGVVVWNPETGCFDILWNMEEIIFDDMTVDVSDIMAMPDPDDNSGGSDNGDDTPDHDLDLDEYIYDEYYSSEEINGYGGHDSFVISADSSEYSWDYTGDGEGIVIWNEHTDCYDVLYNVEEIIFDDMIFDVTEVLGGGYDDGGSDDGGYDDSSSDGSDDGEYIMDDAWTSEVIDGKGGEDTFVIDGDSDDFMWDWTDDGQGIMIWNLNTDATDTLYNVEEIWFNDTSVWVDDLSDDSNGGSDDGGYDDSSSDGSDDGEYIMDDAWTSEIIDGKGGEDTFVIDGDSDDFMWDWTDDGQGIMVWNLDTDATDTLYNVEEIWFNDTNVWVDDLSNGSGSNTNTNSYTNNNTTNDNNQNNNSDNTNTNTGSDTSADEYIMDDASKSEVIDGGAGNDTFVIDGDSSDFMWDTTDDGKGILIYNEVTDTMDELVNVEEIEFNDTAVLVDDLIG